MLEATIVLQLLLGKGEEAFVIALLLVVNALLSFLQENHADNALALLRQRLNVQARVRRDGRWQLRPARELVPGDAVHLRLGDLVPADIILHDGNLQLDQSSLTGESLPVEAMAGATAYSGSIVRRGEATGEVLATGGRTRFGQTADLVRTAGGGSHLQTVIFAIVKYLIALDVLLVATLLIYAALTGMPMSEALPFALILLVASVPVALPATFTLATAIGAMELARHGVLVTHLTAIEEAAALDVLVSDKTGTITENVIHVAAVHPLPGQDEASLLRLAALACDEADQDPIDMAILAAAKRQQPEWPVLPVRESFLPFDPATRRSEARVRENGTLQRVVKGAPQAVAELCQSAADISPTSSISSLAQQLAASGYRVLAVAAGTDSTLRLAGLIALEDPPRPDAAELIDSLQQLGIRVIMATGDNAATAQAIAQRVGIGSRACLPDGLRNGNAPALDACDVFARVYPEDKLQLVRALQADGHIVGMTGDGVNDAPALKQAEVGTAVSNATDVAKAAASLVLTDAGLGNILHAVRASRRIYQRMLTYTLNKIIKTLEIALFLSLGVMLTGVFVITPKLIVLLLFTNDFVTMAIATDQVRYSNRPERWQVRQLLLTAAPLAGLMLILSFSLFFVGKYALHLPLQQLQTLIFVMLVFTGLGNVFLVRERHHFWQSRPSRWLLLSALGDVLAVSLLAGFGILMTPVPPWLIAVLLGITALYLLAVDFIKVRILGRLSASAAPG